MNLAVSNIAWDASRDFEIYKMMTGYGFTGLEIAPTRVFPNNPYSHPEEAKRWAEELRGEYGFSIPSIQSIWYGRQEKIFGSQEERQILLDYTKQAVVFAEVIGCGNLVFGCPRNRFLPDGADESIAVAFFREIGNYAAAHGTVIAMEANPPIYHTNYINETKAALDLIENVGADGFKLNLDLGTMIENGEDISMLNGREHLINHVHISEPGLKPIEQRPIHEALHEMLTNSGYDGFVSIEAGKQESVEKLEEMMKYIKEVFGG